MVGFFAGLAAAVAGFGVVATAGFGVVAMAGFGETRRSASSWRPAYIASSLGFDGGPGVSARSASSPASTDRPSGATSGPVRSWAQPRRFGDGGRLRRRLDGRRRRFRLGRRRGRAAGDDRLHDRRRRCRAAAPPASRPPRSVGGRALAVNHAAQTIAKRCMPPKTSAVRPYAGTGRRRVKKPGSLGGRRRARRRRNLDRGYRRGRRARAVGRTAGRRPSRDANGDVDGAGARRAAARVAGARRRQARTEPSRPNGFPVGGRRGFSNPERPVESAGFMNVAVATPSCLVVASSTSSSSSTARRRRR